MYEKIVGFGRLFKLSIDFLIEKVDLSVFSTYTVIFDILITSIFLYFLIIWVIESNVGKFFSFVILLSIVYLISILFNLIALESLLKFLFLILLIALPIVHQNEIRKGINSLGFFLLTKNKFNKKNEHRVIKEIKHAVEALVRKRFGALIVFEKNINLANYCVTGIMLNSKLSKELIVNIFFPRSPLHDGAIIIKKDIIVSAGSVLPISHNVTDIRYGTRHKAAIGISELSDAIVIVISEERGQISFVKEGEIWPNISLDELEKILFREKI